MIMSEQRSSPSFDEKKAYEQALRYDLVNVISQSRIVLCKCFSYEMIPEVYVTEKLKTYFELKAVQCAVTPPMLLPPFLIATSNLMARSEVII